VALSAVLAAAETVGEAAVATEEMAEAKVVDTRPQGLSVQRCQVDTWGFACSKQFC